MSNKDNKEKAIEEPVEGVSDEPAKQEVQALDEAVVSEASEKVEKTEVEDPSVETDKVDSAEIAKAEDSAEAARAEKSTETEKTEVPEEPPAPEMPDWKGMYARLMADFDNFRKRTVRDREELFKSAASEMVKDLLPTTDNLALALEKASDKKDDPFVTGVRMTYDGLIKVLANHGATPLDSVGEPFDANCHEALATLPSADVAEGLVMNEVKRGWLLNGKLLRAAQVVVSAGSSQA